MPYVNGRWVDDESGEALTPGQGIQPGAGFAPGYDPAIGPSNEKYPGLDPKYNEFADQYGVSNAMVRATRDKMIGAYGGVDAFGPTTAGYVPPAEIAADVQMQHDIAIQRYNAGLTKAAQGYLSQGLDLFQSYRPGGAASLASGQYGQLANVTAQGRLDPIDLMHDYRRQVAHDTRKRQNRAALIQGIGTVIGAAAGGLIGGPPGALVGSKAGGAVGGIAGGKAGAGTQEQLRDFSGGGGTAGTEAGRQMGGGVPASQTLPLGDDQGWGAASRGMQADFQNAAGGGTKQSRMSQPGQAQGGATSQPSSTGGAAGAQAGGAGGAMQASLPMGSQQPMGVGPMGMSNEGVAATYEQRYGEPLDTMWARYASEYVVGFSDQMTARLDFIMSGGNGAA